MKLSEDKEISFQEPIGQFGAKEDITPGIFKLVRVEDCSSLELMLVFSNGDGTEIKGGIRISDASSVGTNNLPLYRKELENLKGKTWSEILEWDFGFHEASRLVS